MGKNNELKKIMVDYIDHNLNLVFNDTQYKKLSAELKKLNVADILKKYRFGDAFIRENTTLLSEYAKDVYKYQSSIFVGNRCIFVVPKSYLHLSKALTSERAEANWTQIDWEKFFKRQDCIQIWQNMSYDTQGVIIENNPHIKSDNFVTAIIIYNQKSILRGNENKIIEFPLGNRVLNN